MSVLGALLAKMFEMAFGWIADRFPSRPRPRVHVLQGHGQPSRVIVENRGARPFTVLSVRSVTGGQFSPSGVVVPSHESAAFVSHAHLDVVYVHIAGMEPMAHFPPKYYQ